MRSPSTSEFETRRLTITGEARRAIVAHMEQVYPQEGCGFLFGHGGLGERFVPMANTAETPETRYAIDPVQQLDVFKAEREAGRELVAIVHSHTDVPARPSPADVAGASYPDTPYLIISVNRGRAVAGRAFVIRNGQFEELRVVIV
ncbi:MAG: M67 family metallopeptidase [Candidatus Sumerlaeia bacterium]